MANNTPLLTVAMSVYNAEKYIFDAVESVLNQTFSDFEFIIVNDGSTDKSLEILKGFSDPRIKIINQENKGLCKSLNLAIRSGTGEYIARMDADDICHPERFMKQVDFLRDNADCVVVGSNADYIDVNGNYLYTSRCKTDWHDIKNVLPASPFFHSATLFRRSAFQLTGGYYEKIPHFFEDKILWNMMAQHGCLCNLPESLIKYRIVPSSITAEKSSLPALDAIFNKILNGNEPTPLEIEFLFSRKKSKPAPNLLLSNYHLRIGKIYIEYNFNRKLSVKNLLLAIKFRPKSIAAWFNLFLASLPRNLIYKWKNYRSVYDKQW